MVGACQRPENNVKINTWKEEKIVAPSKYYVQIEEFLELETKHV